MSTADLEAKVDAIIIDQLDVLPVDVIPTANIREHLGADSLDLAQMVLALEEAFDIKIDDSDGDRMNTVQDVYDVVGELVKP